MSKEIIGPNVWGPVIWHALHYISLGYPVNPSEDQKQKYKTFFSLLSDVIPCSICRNHFSENLIKMRLSDEFLKTKESLIKWLIDFHNIVNELNKKPIIKYEEARQLIENNTKCNHNIIYEQKKEPSEKNIEIIVKEDFFNKLFKLNSIYYLIGLLLLIILISILFKKKSV